MASIPSLPVVQASGTISIIGEPGAGSREPGAGSREPGAGSREPGAGSREPGAGSREPGAGSREPGAGSREPGAGSREPGCARPAGSSLQPHRNSAAWLTPWAARVSPGGAQTLERLVGNAVQGTVNTLTTFASDMAQPFTTGAHYETYRTISVKLDFNVTVPGEDGGRYSSKLCAATTSGSPVIRVILGGYIA